MSVAQRRMKAQKQMAKLRKKGMDAQPIEIAGRKITRTFWGKAWCDHIESFSDYTNRLPRGKRYVRNGSVCHLEITKGRVKAIVSGSELYNIKVGIKPLVPQKWAQVKRGCAGQIGSLLELLQGKLSSGVMGVVTDRDKGLFPGPREISFHCDCPDWATMCKHVAAVMYGVGARLDEQPELLFLLRGVDHEELIAAQAAFEGVTGRRGGRKRIAKGDISDVFGIDLADARSESKVAAKAPKKTAQKRVRKKTAKKAAKKAAKKVVKKTVKKTTKESAPRKTTQAAKATRKKKAVKKAKKAARKIAKKTVKRTVKKTEKKSTPGTTAKVARKRKAVKKAAKRKSKVKIPKKT